MSLRSASIITRATTTVFVLGLTTLGLLKHVSVGWLVISDLLGIFVIEEHGFNLLRRRVVDDP